MALEAREKMTTSPVPSPSRSGRRLHETASTIFSGKEMLPKQRRRIAAILDGLPGWDVSQITLPVVPSRRIKAFSVHSIKSSLPGAQFQRRGYIHEQNRSPATPRV